MANLPLHMQYYQNHVLSGCSKPLASAAPAAAEAAQAKRPPPIPVPYAAKGENTLVQQYLKDKIAAPKPLAPKKDDLRRYYAPVSDPKEISLHASHYVVPFSPPRPPGPCARLVSTSAPRCRLCARRRSPGRRFH